MSRQIHAKPDTCTERGAVDPTRISVKVGAQYPGRSAVLPIVLAASRGVGRHVQKSAEGIVGEATAEGPNDEAESRTE